MRGELETEQNCNILTPPNSSGYNSISFPFSWAAQPGTGGPSLFWDMVLIPASSLQLTDFLSHSGYIIIWHPPASCGVTIRTQFNPSTIKVIPRYLRPDAAVIYTGAFLIWQLGRVGGQYVTVVQNSESEAEDRSRDSPLETMKEQSVFFFCLPSMNLIMVLC